MPKKKNNDNNINIKDKILNELAELSEEELLSLCISDTNNLVVATVLEHKKMHSRLKH